MTAVGGKTVLKLDWETRLVACGVPVVLPSRCICRRVLVDCFVMQFVCCQLRLLIYGFLRGASHSQFRCGATPVVLAFQIFRESSHSLLDCGQMTLSGLRITLWLD